MRMMNIKEAAQLTGLGVGTLYKYKLLGRIPFTKIGTRVLFDADALEAWLREKSYTPEKVKP